MQTCFILTIKVSKNDSENLYSYYPFAYEKTVSYYVNCIEITNEHSNLIVDLVLFFLNHSLIVSNNDVLY